ncbi:hypothetical protein B0J18DRAFT_249585 [Chaetomium sp. MPI-SDFR-AT-0129]|nr:hypothetical protein B0J18DRAFT_249585 [Chaetomium sp. MPI-SDFR-AT-0129]
MGSRLEKNSEAVRKRIANHEFHDEDGDEYAASSFGGFGEYFEKKQLKLQNLDAELRATRGDTPQIFKGVVAHVTGYTQPPLHVLHKDLVLHGAAFLQYLGGKTMATHIIASAMPPRKTVDFTRYRVVKPAWVTDSIRAGKLLPWSDYRVLDDGPRQKTIRFEGGRLLSQAGGGIGGTQQPSPRGYREQTQNSFYTSQFSQGGQGQGRGQKAGGRLGGQGSSSPFQPTPSRKGVSVELEGIKDFDDLDVDMLLEDPILAEEGLAKEVLAEKQPSVPPVDAQLPDSGPTSPPPDQAQPEETGDTPQPPEKSMAAEKPMTSEEHNALLLQDPKIRKSSTANPDFLKQYYSESRLHHLSTWKAQLKARLMNMAAERGPAPTKTKRKPGTRRYIMHVDFDSFFCAVSLNQHAPDARDKPAVVAHSSGSGSEIASCNYPARAFGVKNGMWMKRAKELCPDLKVVPYDFPAYEEASRQFYDAILGVGGVVQSVSIDEALVDVTDIVLAAAGSEGVGVSEGSMYREQAKVDEIATSLRAEIKKRTDCHVSVGMGGNVLLAKVALRKAKPAGQHQIRPEEVLDVLADLKVESLPGVAYSIGGKLEEVGIKLVRDLRETSKERLTTLLGPKTGEKLWEYARGVDRTEVGEQPMRKSVSADVNWGIRFISQDEAEEFVRNLCKELERRLLGEYVKGKNMSMKIMRRSLDAPLDPAKHLGHGQCDTFTKSVAFGVATNDSAVLGKEAVAILRSYKFSPGDLRGLGVQMTKLEPIKASAAPEGSQRKLNFGVPPPAKRLKTEAVDGVASVVKPLSRRLSGQEVEEDPISVDPLTPRKHKVHPALALAKANAADEKANSPLNLTGTQFVLPSNADPAVLAELPDDIRTKLMRQAKRPPSAPSCSASPAVPPRPESPAVTDEIPPDVDPEVFHALPEDMKAEVLASYGHRKQPSTASVVHQSPRKDRIVHRPRDRGTPPRRGGSKSLLSRGRGRERQQDAEAGLMQTSLAPVRPAVSNPGNNNGNETASGPDDNLIADLDPSFLAELPEDVRAEVVEDHRRRKLAAQRRSLKLHAPVRATATTSKNATTSAGTNTSNIPRIKFPPKPHKLPFASSTQTSLPEIKETIAVWHEATRDEGPHAADVEVFARYLQRVVTEERDMEKAGVLVKDVDGVRVEGRAV